MRVNVTFFKRLKDAGIAVETLPRLSVSVAEEEIRAIGGDMAILLVEQFLDFALSAASHYYVMEKDQIVAEGATHQISQATVQQYLAV